MILAVDTSLSYMSVALTRADELLGCIALEGSRSRNEKLLAAVDWLLSETGVERSALEMLAVTRGPGSFTGVRIGLATMQGLSFALGIPLCALPTHEAVALGDPGLRGRRTLVWSDAGRSESYATGFSAEGIEEMPISLLAAEQLTERRSQYEAQADLSLWVQAGNLAACAARCTARLAAEGLLGTRADATPIYVRLAEAEVRLRGQRE